MTIKASRYEKARAMVIASYRERWKATLDGKLRIDAPGVFEAPLKKIQSGMARRFYDKAHIQKLLSLPDTQIEESLLPLIRYLVVQKEKPLRQSLVDDLLCCQYILFSYYGDDVINKGSGSAVELEGDDFDGWSVMQYPSSIIYDDWYERVGGGGTFLGVLMKASGEPFTKFERQHLAKSVYWNVLGNERETLWSFGFHWAGKRKNQVVVAISGFSPEYRYALKDHLKKLDVEAVKRLAAAIEPLRADEDSPFSQYIDSSVPNLRRLGSKAIIELLINCVFDIPEEDADHLNAIEKVIAPYLFGGREYFHSYLKSTVDIGEFGFFDEV